MLMGRREVYSDSSLAVSAICNQYMLEVSQASHCAVEERELPLAVTKWQTVTARKSTAAWHI